MSEQQTDLVQQLMDFRTTYLRAVARASVDLPFRQRLTARGGNPLQVFREEFGYECPWFLNFVLHDDPGRGPRLDPASGTMMTLPCWGETITVYIPKPPPGNDPKLRMDALAAYYDENPWFLCNKEGRTVTNTAPKAVIDPPEVWDGQWISVSMNADRNARFNLGVCFEEFISFSAAMFNAVALAWDNELFMTALTRYKGEDQQRRMQTINLMNEWLGYRYPWQIDLIVQEDLTAQYDPVQGCWINTTAPVLMLTIPWMTGALDPGAAAKETEANQRNTSLAVLGLTLYNTDGAGYPFTCG